MLRCSLGAAAAIVTMGARGASAFAGVPAAPDPPLIEAAPAPVVPPDELALARVLRSGCAEGVADLRAAAAALPPGERQDLLQRLAAMCDDIARERAAAAPPPPAGAHQVDHSGRAKLILAMTGYGLWAGIAIDIMLDVDDARTAVIAPLAGLGSGLALSLAATRDRELTSGQAWTIITGLDYGSWSGLLWSAAADVDTGQRYAGITLAAGAAGGLAATAIALSARPSAGDAEAVRSGGLWGFTAGALLALIVRPTDTNDVFGFMAAGMDGGLAVGAALARAFDLSRNRMLLIDAGSLAGLALGAGTAVMILGDSDGDDAARLGGGIMLAGLAAGMLTATYLTRDMAGEDDHTLPAMPALVARDPRGRWRLGVPAIAPIADPRGGLALGAAATLVGGAW